MQSLLDKPQYVEELSERLDLAASTVSFHLKKLEQAQLVSKKKEQYYVVFYPDLNRLALTLRELVAVEDSEKSVQDARIQQYRQKVIRTFFQQGRLSRLPSQQKKRRIILEEIAKKFQTDRQYSEQELNDIIAEVHEDYCTIRREMVDWKIMAREGGRYWRLDDNASETLISSLPQQTEGKNTMDRRKELKLAYKQTLRSGGVFQVKNLVNGKCFIGSAPDVDAKLNGQYAELKLGSHRNKALLQDWNTYGPDNFTFEVLEYLEPRNDPHYTSREELATIENIWLDKLQPYGEQGYNPVPKDRPLAKSEIDNCKLMLTAGGLCQQGARRTVAAGPVAPAAG